MRRVVVTGMGIVSSIGNNTQEVLASLREAKSGISAAPEYAEKGFRSLVHGQPSVKPEEVVDKRNMRFMGEGSGWNFIAMEQAIQDSGLTPEEVSNPRRRLELIVADFNGDRHLRAILLDKSKMVAMASKLAPPEDVAPEWLYSLLAGQPKSVQVKLPPAFDGQGSVVLQADPHNEVGEVWNDAKLYLALLFSAMVADVKL